MPSWFDDLRRLRLDFVDAARNNKFERGIWHASVDKYAEPTHFILELLQNAEDQNANYAVLRVTAERIIFEHDGASFTAQDVENITGIGNTAKPNQTNKIGCFGIGFKSVFVTTERPEIYSWIGDQPFAFAIRDLVVPELIAPASSRQGWTRFELPLKPTLTSTFAKSVRERMSALGPRVLLFLQSINKLDWSVDGSGESFVRESRSDGITALRRSQTGNSYTQVSLNYLVFRRNLVDIDFLYGAEPTRAPGQQRSLSVSIAFRLNANGEIEPEPQRSRLSVFFETQEETGLLFLVHGPFLLTDNRANIKQEEPLNERLVDEIAALTCESLDKIRDRKLLSRTFLGVLPNRSDYLSQTWLKVREQIIRSMQTRRLVPTKSGSHGAVDRLRRGPASLRALLSDQDLVLLFGVTGIRWAVAGLRNQREERFLDDLGIVALTVDDLVASLARLPNVTEQWLAKRTNGELQQLYLLLRDAQSTKPQLRCIAIVRVTDKRHVRGIDAYFAPTTAKASEQFNISLPLVNSEVLRHADRSADLHDFLRSVGVTDVDDAAYVKAILIRFYRNLQRAEMALHKSHIARFIDLWNSTRSLSIFTGYSFLISDEQVLMPAETLYIDSPYLSTGLHSVYSGDQTQRVRRYRLWDGYAHYKLDSFVDFVLAVGINNRLQIQTTQTSAHPQRHYLQGTGVAFRPRGGTDVDYIIEDLRRLLSRNDTKISSCIWNTMSEAPTHVLHAVYQPNKSAQPRSAPSSLVLVLSQAAWIPDKHGQLQKPCDIPYSSLSAPFTVGQNKEWLEAIGLASKDASRSREHQAQVSAAKAIGMPDELTESLLALSSDVRADLWQQMLLFARNRSAETAGVRPLFPERESANPVRRAQRIAEQARDAPKKQSAKRERTVRIRDTYIEEQTKIYLRGMYTNEIGQLVCQVCQREMPFRLADGSHFFVAAEFIKSLENESIQNHLALCPVCAAKYLYANKTDYVKILEIVSDKSGLVIPVELAGQQSTIRFVRDHLDDLTELVKAL